MCVGKPEEFEVHCFCGCAPNKELLLFLARHFLESHVRLSQRLLLFPVLNFPTLLLRGGT